MGFFNRERIIAARTERVKARAEVAKQRKWSFISIAVTAVVVLLLYYTGGLTALGLDLSKIITLFVK